MTDGYILILLVAVVTVLILIIAKSASFGKRFAEDTRYICYEMDHAESYNEYRRWRGELRCHYLCLIPFVTEKNVMRLYDRIFHRSDLIKKEERKDSIVPLLMPSILGIGLCMICVCGMTWAWYSASVQSSAQKVTAAYYEVTVDSVTVKSGNNEITAVNGVYDLTAGTTYEVKLTASGSVKECGGYCLIECGDTKYYTQTFKPKQNITITLIPTKSDVYTFTGVWGSIPSGVAESEIIKDIAAKTENTTVSSTDNTNTLPVTNDTTTAEQPVKQPTVDDTYTVQSGDSLSVIANKFNTTSAKLAAYNNIDDPRYIKSGQVLKIPPQNYVIPETTAPSVTSDQTKSPVAEPVTDAPAVKQDPIADTSIPADTANSSESASAETD